MKNDQLDRAVTRAMAQPPTERRGSITLNLPGGRQAVVDAPLDLTTSEALLIVGFVANGLANALNKLAAEPALEVVKKPDLRRI